MTMKLVIIHLRTFHRPNFSMKHSDMENKIHCHTHLDLYLKLGRVIEYSVYVLRKTFLHSLQFSLFYALFVASFHSHTLYLSFSHSVNSNKCMTHGCKHSNESYGMMKYNFFFCNKNFYSSEI